MSKLLDDLRAKVDLSGLSQDRALQLIDAVMRLEREHDRLVTVVTTHQAAIERIGVSQPDPVERLRAELGDTAKARDEAVEIVAQLRRDHANALALAESRWRWANQVADTERKQTVEAIADHLEQRAQALLAPYAGVSVPHAIACRAAGLTDAVDALRAGTWRDEP